MDLFRVRMNCIDHYQATPTHYDPQLRNDIRSSQISKGPKVPVVRVFGSTETGQKVCAHIHGAFPYLYVEYTGSLAPDEVGAFIYRLHLSIDHALAVSYRRDQYGNNVQFVARITLVKGVPFYGFHVGYRFFLKIYMFNPIVMTRLADLLQQGVIMHRKFQPYEAHLQYLLQFMVDYNLYGCDYLDSFTTKFRSPVPKYREGSNSLHLWHSSSVPPSSITDDSALPRVSHCSIEVDICVQDIANRKRIKERPLHHDFTERIAPLPNDIKLVHSMAGLWKDETKRRKRRMHHATEGSSPFPPEVLISMSANPRDAKPQGWIHEEEFRLQMGELIASETAANEGTHLEFDSFVKLDARESNINTALESVEDLHPSNLLPVLGLSADVKAVGFDPTSSIEVDEQQVLRLEAEAEDNFFPDDSDEDELFDLVDDVDENLDQALNAAERSTPADLRAQEGALFLEDACNLEDWDSLGLFPSAFVTGELPRAGFSQPLLEVAEDEGYVTRVRGLGNGRQAEKAILKRTGSAASVFDNPIKRIRLNQNSRPTDEDVEIPPGCGSIIARRDIPNSLEPSAATLGSQNSSNQQDQRLNFAIVKNQPDPNTRLRLTQQSQKPSASSGNHGRGVTKRVLFEPYSSAGSQGLSASGSPSFTYAPNSSSSQPNSQRHELQTAQSQHLSSSSFILTQLPPTTERVAEEMRTGPLPEVVYQDAFYSKEKDVPNRMREYAGREFCLEGNTLPFLPDFDYGMSETLQTKQPIELERVELERAFSRQSYQCSLKSWEFAQPAPSYRQVTSWQARKERGGSQGSQSRNTEEKRRQLLSQIDGSTPRNRHAFKYSQKPKSTGVQHQTQYMSTMSLEIHVNTRGKFVPNPEEDEIQCIFWSLTSDDAILTSQDRLENIRAGILVLSPDGALTKQIERQTSAEVVSETTELDLLVRMVETVRTHDPDVLTGYEVHGTSWGYLIERARFKYDYNLCDELSRVRSQSHGRFGKDADRWGFTTTSTIRVTGRHMINIWRAMRGELNLLQYTMENVAWHLLHRRLPHYAWKTLTACYQSGKPRDLAKVIRYYEVRTRLDIEILEANELIPRTSEQARLLGVDFFSVFSRGSQYKVESIMFRIAKPENFILISPSKKQVGGQNALECIPLVMEPQSAFYPSPLLVLDFQSLYPSVMIAYNLCYSTFLGRITNWRGMNKMGFTEYKRQQGVLALLKDYINIAPNGMMYVKTEIRKSLLAKMLTEILETRVMVKSGMKQDKDDKMLQQLLNNRQLALKLLANVTYGYTSASFSGRMPCSEIADSIVQTARETLERAIAYIHTVERWGAEVVYGDTDSLFVYLKGRTREEAFDIGNDIAETITKMNPRPIKLKFEKVYHPCVLLAKKRYVGYKYESKGQGKPEFDAKGIETVRRDGTPAEQLIEEKALRLLFETADLSQIKEYFQKECDKIMRGAVSVQDFCFAKEVRLGTYSDKGLPPAGAMISTKRMLEDARAEPQYGERVPYVVVSGAPGARLIDRSVSPEELLANPHWQLDAQYYISKNLIPPLERIFNLVGADVRQWYEDMPKIQRVHQASDLGSRKSTLESYMQSSHCLRCRCKFKTHRRNAARAYGAAAMSTNPVVGHSSGAADTAESLCPACRANVPGTLLALQTRLATEERRFEEVLAVCRGCSGLGPMEEVTCDSKDCPVFWTRMKQQGKVRGEQIATQPIIKALVAGVDKLALEW